MKDLKRRFLMMKEQYPQIGDVVIMGAAVQGQSYPKEVIQKVFNSCVGKDEYEKSEKSEIIESLVAYSKKAVLEE